MYFKYLINYANGNCFNLPVELLQVVLRLTSEPFNFIDGWGDLVIKLKGFKVGFTNENFGMFVIFAGESISKKPIAKFLDEFSENVEKVTGKKVATIALVDIIISVDDAGDDSVRAKYIGDEIYMLLDQPLNDQYEVGELVKPERSPLGLKWLILPRNNPNQRH